MKPIVLALVGQTASGKNRLAVEAVEQAQLPVEIVSLDSMKVFRRMDIGTAKPSADLRARVPHHLLDVVDPWEYFDAARYFELFAAVEADIRARGKVPLVVGGTGMYLQLLAHGHFDGPSADSAVRHRLRAEVEAHGSASLHARLQQFDPASAARIHPNDAKRLIRAVEVFELTGRPISAVQTQFDRPRDDVHLALFGLRWDKERLARRINARCREMFAAGWIEEVRAIRDETPGFGPQAGDALGYREILWHLAGEWDLDKTEREVARRTRQFAKRQLNWFRRFPIRWFDLQPDISDSPAAHAEFVHTLATAMRDTLATPEPDAGTNTTADAIPGQRET